MPSESASTAASPRKTRRTAEERRVDVLAAAIREFATYGLHGGSTERIAEVAGISQPYVLRLFGTKKALFLAAQNHVCDHIIREWETGLDLLLVHTPDANVGERLEALGKRYITLVHGVDELRLILQAYASAEDPDIRELIHGWLDRMFTWVEQHAGTDPEETRQFFATGMMLTVAASIHAIEASADQRWAQAYTMRPIGPPPV